MKRCRKRRGVDLCLLLLIDVALVERHDDRHAQFQQLSGKKQAAGKIRCVHDVDDHIRALIFDIGTRHALF